MLRSISRRTVLKGIGTSLALPYLEAFLPRSARGGQEAARAFPKRMAFLYIPNGAIMPLWRPRVEGTEFELPRILQGLEPHRSEMLVLGGLTDDKARSNGDGPGDHARAMSSFLTATQPYKTGGSSIRAGISADQLAAQRVGNATRFASLELSCEYGRQDGICDSGYSCAYSNNLSWRSPTTPAPKEVNPRLVFDRLFGGQDARETSDVQAQREYYNQSILDFVREDTTRLRNQLGAADMRRMDEYLTSVRDVERRLTQPAGEVPAAVANAMARPTRIPESFREHLRLMADLLTIAFQGDLTRISTLVFGIEGSRKSYPEIGVTDEHHAVSHHQNRTELIEKHARINEFHVGELAYFLGKLRSVREGEGTLLDNCMICYGGANADGNSHSHNDLPILLFGKGGGTITPGRHIRYPNNTPVANLFLSMLDRMNVPGERFGDSTGRLTNLAV